jgi:hypothetical protein
MYFYVENVKNRFENVGSFLIVLSETNKAQDESREIIVTEHFLVEINFSIYRLHN